MTMRRAIVFAALASAIGLLGGYSMHVLAEGAPTQQPLFYAGSLEHDGAPASGDYTLTLTLYDAQSGGAKLCTSSSEVSVENGRFRADVSDCADALTNEPDAWVAVSFLDSKDVDHAIEGRSKIGAVPYALEAQHSVAASHASQASGALAEQLSALQDRVAALEGGETGSSGFQASKHEAQTVTNFQFVWLEEEAWDFGDEYDRTTSIFTTKEGGYYEFSCALLFSTTQQAQGKIEASIWVNDSERAVDAFIGDPRGATRRVRAVVKLAPNDRVRCGVTVDAALGEQPLSVAPDQYYVTFEGHRFAR